jgi:hypothetical protein
VVNFPWKGAQEIYAHMIHGQDDEAARKWEEFQRTNLAGKETGVQ